MRQKQLISPEQSSLDRTKYRFKISFIRFFSLCITTYTLLFFVSEIVSPNKISNVPTQNLTLVFALILCALLLISVLATYLASLMGDITISPIEIGGCNLWGSRTHINWHDVIAVKSYRTFGIRNSAIIKSRTTRKKNIHVGLFLYDLPKMLDRVREYAGEDHPLTIALEKEVSLPRQKPAKVLWQIIGATCLILGIWLIGGNLVAAKQEEPLNRSIAEFVRQHPRTPPNQSAIDLQTSISKLGLSLVQFGDGSKVKVSPTQVAIDEWKSIAPILDKYVTDKLDKDSSNLLPAKLSTYLNTHRSDIEAIQTQLINNDLPEWGSDSRWIDRGNSAAGDSLTSLNTNYLNPLKIQRLLIAHLLYQQSLHNSDISKNLEAIGKLNRSFQSQTLIIGQLVNLISERNINNLVRLLDRIPDRWEKSFNNYDRTKKMMRIAIVHESMMSAKMIQDPQMFEMMGNGYLSFFARYHHLARPYTRVVAANYYQKVQQRLAYWEHQNICHTDGKDGSDRDWNSIDTFLLARQYPKVARSAIDRELTTSVRQIKSQLQSGAQIEQVANEFNLASQTCPGEKWTARVKDGAVAISFSHPPNWGALGMVK